MQRDYWYSIARDRERARGRRADRPHRRAARAGARRGATPHDAQGAGGLHARHGARPVRHFVGAISGTSQYRKSSFLLNAAGEQMFPSFLSMQERPHMPQGLASSPFDQEGAAHARPRAGARRGPRRLRARQLLGAAPGTEDHRQRRWRPQSAGEHRARAHSAQRRSCSACTPGLLVTELMGQGVNGVTGDYSRGASGLLGRERRDRLPGARDHDRRQPETDVPRHRRARRRHRHARRHPHRLGARRRDDHRRGVGAAPAAALPRQVARVSSPQRSRRASSSAATTRSTGGMGRLRGREVAAALAARDVEDLVHADARDVARRHQLVVVGDDEKPRALERCRHLRHGDAGQAELVRETVDGPAPAAPATCVRPTKYMSLSASCSSSTLERRSCCSPSRR